MVGALALAAIALYEMPRGATSAPPVPAEWPKQTLLQYGSRGTSAPRGVTDGLTVRQDGTAIVVLLDYPRRSVHRACLRERRVKRLTRLLQRAVKLDERLKTRPYPRRGEQHLRFGQKGRRSLHTYPDPELPAMTGRLRQKLFRAVDAIRVKARRSDRDRPCPGGMS